MLILIAALMLDDLIRNVFVTPTLLRVIRVFRIGRVLRLIKAAKGIRKLLFALIISLPALFNIGALLFLIMFIYAIIGMTSFGNLRLGGALNEVVNFQTFGNSMVLLFRLCTSAGWNDVLEPLLRTPGCDPDFSGLPTYEAGGCGSPWLAVPYLTSYILIAFMIIINMYIAIILENFNLAHAQEEVGITEDDIDMFYAHWSRFDQNATQLINFSELSDFVAGLDPPFCIPKPNNIALTSFNLPIVEGDKLHCLDVIRALTKFAMSDVEETAEFAMLQSNIEDKFKEAFPTRRKIIIVSSTMDRKREDRAAKSIQHAWRRWRSRDEAANSTPSINALAAAATPSLFRKAAMKRFLRTPTSQRRSRSPSPSRRQGLSRNDSSRTASQRSLAVPVSTV
ncbi:PREDICTED: sodium channel protein 1 brain-like [Priapulus caudatus]|uniref:Sodium channel protein n=1 Tax=Priapulus caudatus TaxID=37621 RepID=A0ABM1DRX8_PRICU|nr:PREDICTED: sodium channel protein 1 brain-like [Priapulus caudatus]